MTPCGAYGPRARRAESQSGGRQSLLLRPYRWQDHGMKVSVSLPDEDVDFLDQYAKQEGFESRSAVLHKAVRLLRASGLGAAHEEAWREWAASGEEELWESTSADGLSTQCGEGRAESSISILAAARKRGSAVRPYRQQRWHQCRRGPPFGRRHTLPPRSRGTPHQLLYRSWAPYRPRHRLSEDEAEGNSGDQPSGGCDEGLHYGETHRRVNHA